MTVFGARYYTDGEIWSRVRRLEEERDKVQAQLALPDISTDSEVMPVLARQLHQLEQFCVAARELRNCLSEFEAWREMLGEYEHSEDEREELERLGKEYAELCANRARRVVRLLVERGCLDKEMEDEKDLEILQFIDYAGPEYAWRLGINIGLDVAEARRRLELLLEKGLLERVEGNMLENYHRAKSWTKHMNHTYYRITRQGRHYLRKLRNKGK
ncbi:MAG: DUF2250 domain-containing protein [Firmicutes bacterium]|nr:DUF2250 domain-containing protein [Bacillota bacterium]